MKVVMSPMGLDPDGDAAFYDELRAAFPQVTIEPAATVEEQVSAIRDADVYFGFPRREVYLSARQLKWVHCAGAGIDKISEIPEMIESDVVLTNTRGPHAAPMADHVLALMLSLAHHLSEQRDDQRDHRWETIKYSGRFAPLGGRTMGILALGDIGTEVARRAHGFGMQVYAVDRHPERVVQRNGGTAPPEVTELWGLDRLDEMLSMSDWFVVTSPLTPETRGLIDRRRVGLLKEGAHVVVISRGSIIDEDALVEGLRSGRIAGAGIDTVAVEPLPDDSPLWDMDNVVLSPHVASMTAEMWDGRRQVFKENLRRFLANEPFLYVCDKRAGF